MLDAIAFAPVVVSFELVRPATTAGLPGLPGEAFGEARKDEGGRDALPVRTEGEVGAAVGLTLVSSPFFFPFFFRLEGDSGTAMSFPDMKKKTP